MKKINLLLFPFAGGSKYSYNPFREHVPEYINLIPFDLPGRGTRFREPLLKDMHAMADDLFRQIQVHISDAPYAVYAHSMGTVLAHLVTSKLIENNLPLPLELFLTGRGGPEAAELDNWHKLPSPEFREKIRELGGSPKEVLEDESIMEFIEPILRADFEAIENFTYPEFKPFDIPVTIITGTEEDVTEEEILSWQRITNKNVDFRIFRGHHFFIFDEAKAMFSILSGKLKQHEAFSSVQQ